MVKVGDYTVSDIYQGSYSSLEPGYGSMFSGYRTSMSTLGTTTDARSANILKEVSDQVAPGQKAIEITMISPEIMETIPGPHLTEVNRLAKLTGVDISVHGPVVEPSGLGREGFTDLNREVAERQMVAAVEKTHEVSPDGNATVTFHSSGGLPGREIRMTEKGEEVERMLIVDQETGQTAAVKKETKHYPLMRRLKEGKVEEVPLEEGKTFSAEKNLEIMNQTQWHDSLAQIEFDRSHAERILENIHPIFRDRYIQWATGQIDLNSLTQEETEQIQKVTSANEYLEHAQQKMVALFNKAYTYGKPEEQHLLSKISEGYKNALGIKKDGQVGRAYFDPKSQSSALFALTDGLRKVQPEIFKPIDEFAMDKSAETFGNVAYQSYEKFKDKAPIIAIENPPAGPVGESSSGFAFSRGKELKEIVDKSREQFVKKAVEEGMGKDQAKRQAEKLIGVTWDVGHINQLRRFGFTEKDIVKETEQIAPYLKHVHLSDNFGMSNVELPMGMGNVPLKEIMEKLGKKAEDVKKIVEAGSWYQHFKVSPMAQTLETLGSPIYSMKQAPYWNQAVGFEQSYFSGYGQILPPINYETFGAGFSQLPMELGGQIQGAPGSRMSGTPME